MPSKDTELKSVSTWMENLSGFSRPLIERIYKTIRKTAPQLEEAIRWNSPTFIGRGLVCSFAAFQKHVALVFWRGAELDDPGGLLVHGQGRSAMRSAKFNSLDQIDEKVIRSWVAAAVTLDGNSARPKPKPQKRPEVEVPKALASALKRNAKARAAFDKIPPSHRREYCEWISEAKQEATAQRRLEKTLEKLSAGEGLHDKYRS